MAGRAASNAVTRYAGIQVQTSSLGLQIPVGWGTFRCRCNLVWYADFQAKAQKAASGKGGAAVTGYSYSASLILAICEGPIDAVTQVWVNSNTYAFGSLGSGVANTQNKPALTQAGLSLATGAIGQPVWSYLTPNHPNQAIGYSGLAIAYAANYPLDASAATPNHSFEVVRTSGFGVAGTPDADPSQVVADFLQNPRTGVPGWPAGLLGGLAQYQAYCLASGLLISPVVDQQRSASDALTEFLLATNSTCVWSEGLLKFIPYGDTAVTGNGVTYTPDTTPVYSLTDDQFIVAADGDPPLQCDVQDQSDAYNVVQLEYLDRGNQYNMAIALASDAANIAQYGARRRDPTTVHCICTPTVAATSAQLYLQRTLYIRGQYKFRLGWMFALLEPGDLLALNDPGLGLSDYMVRIVQIDEDETYGLSLTCEDYPIGVFHAPLYALQTGQGTQVNRNAPPGFVERNLLTSSNDVTGPGWSLGLATASGGQPDPFGGATAQRLTATATSGVHGDSAAATVIDGSADLPYTYSRYLRAGASHLAALTLGAGGGAAEAVFDLAAGAVVSSSTAGGAVLVAAGLAPVAGAAGWFRAFVTAQLPAGSTAAQASASILNAAGALSYAAAGTESLYVAGAQLEPGELMNAYVPTLTRPAAPQIFNPPVALTPGSVETWAAVAGPSAQWGGANVWVSYDGGEYELIGVVSDGPARYGMHVAALPAAADPDTADTILVDLSASNGQLTTAAEATADAAGTLCLVDQELISFSTATLEAPFNYALSTYTRRGVANSAIAAHAAGAPFVRLDSAIFQFPYLAAQAGRQALVKFQSFNQWGLGLQPLSQCVAYPCVPAPAGARAPAAGAWQAVGTTLANAGQTIPAIVITGVSDNPAATGIEFQYRVTGTAVWASAGVASNATTRKEITSVQSGQSYDVAVLYIVGGLPSNQEIIATGIVVGMVATGGAGGSGGGGGGGGVGPAPGAVLINDSAPGAGKTFTCPAGSLYAHVDIVLTGPGGSGSGVFGGKSGTSVDSGGGGGGTAVVTSFAVTPGATTFTYTIPAGVGSAASCTASGLSLTAGSGTSASGATPGVGGTASGGGANYAGHNGGLVNTWDGGGAANLSGAYADNDTDGQPGGQAGQAGAGTWLAAQPGGGSSILIIARA